ncbi:MAG TPA: 2-phospho-L-lactate transferase CofD family protein [Burkholderiales bacterium]
MGTVVALAAQFGGAKLADGLYRLRGKQLAVIANTGDDYEHLGLHFSPDLDTLLYTLAGISSTAGWEPEGETRAVHGMLKVLGGPDRPVLGDKSLATALLRGEGLANDRRLTEITLDFCRRLGVAAQLLPMSDEPVRTHVATDQGTMSFHEYYNTHSCEPAAHGFQYMGAAEARVSDEALEALHSADLEAVVICPANPYHGVRPILEVGRMRELIRSRGVPVVAVTPIVGGKALRGTAGKLMRDLGKEPSARAAAAEYLRVIDGFVIDREDLADAEAVRSLGIEVIAANTVMRSAQDRVALARTVLDFAATLRESRMAEAR